MISGHMDEVGFMVTRLINMVLFHLRQLVDGGIKSCYLKSNDYNRFGQRN